MKAETDNLTVSYLQSSQKLETRTNNIFRGSMAMSVLLLVTFGFLPHGAGRLATFVNLAFPPLLLWSFALTAYAFHALSVVSKEKEKLLERSAATDLITGVKSRGYIRSLLETQYENASRTGEPTTVLYVDLQNLRQVNQNLGHTVGDIVLRNLAELVEEAVPEDGVVGRVGGDEFIVLLPGFTTEKAEGVARAIRRKVQEYRLDLGQDRKVDFLRCRIGVVGCPKDGSFADEIIGFAQKASYEASRDA